MGRLAEHGRERHAPPDGQLLRYASGRPVTSRRYDHLWTRIGRHLPWVRTQQIINSMKAQIATVQSKVASLKPVTVFDYDSGTAACGARILDWVVDLRCGQDDGRSDGWLAG